MDFPNICGIGYLIECSMDTRSNDNQTFPLNFQEYGYVAFEGLMGSMPQTYMMRMGAPVDANQLKAVIRELLSTNPRLRAVVEPGLHLYQLRVLPDTDVIDELLDVAWSVRTHEDAQDLHAMERLHRDMQNDILPIERGLMCKFVLVPHAQTPVFFMAVHHIVGDGRTMLHLVTQVMLRINGGEPMAFQPVQAPPLSRVFGPVHWWQWPRTVWRSLKHERSMDRTLKQAHVQKWESRQNPFFSAHGLCHYRIPASATSLRKVARHLGISLNALIVLAVVETFLQRAKDDPLATAVIRQAMDVRGLYPKGQGYEPLWGNHVGVFLLLEQGQKSLQERGQSLKQQMEMHAKRYAEHEVFGRYAFMEMVPVLGRTLLAYLTTRMMRAGKLPELSCYVTNIGSVDRLLPENLGIPLLELIPGVPSPTLLHAVSESRDVLSMGVAWQVSHMPDVVLQDYLTALSNTFKQLEALVT